MRTLLDFVTLGSTLGTEGYEVNNITKGSARKNAYRLFPRVPVKRTFLYRFSPFKANAKTLLFRAEMASDLRRVAILNRLKALARNFEAALKAALRLRSKFTS